MKLPESPEELIALLSDPELKVEIFGYCAYGLNNPTRYSDAYSARVECLKPWDEALIQVGQHVGLPASAPFAENKGGFIIRTTAGSFALQHWDHNLKLSSDYVSRH